MAVPIFNRPDYIPATLGSVLAQDYAKLEIIVSDNASSDGTYELARRVVEGDRRVTIRRNAASQPIHVHFNQCVREARGEFFILLCDDDLINPTLVSELVAVAGRYPDASVVVPANATIDEQGRLVREFARSAVEILDGSEFVCRWLHERGPKMFANAVTVLTRTELVREVGGYQGLGGGRNNDNLLFLQCALAGRVGFAQRAVFSWRVHERSFGSGVTPRQLAESARGFVDHLRHDPWTVRALARLPGSKRREIIRGVRYMTARELVFHMRAGRPARRSTWPLHQVPWYRWDASLCRVLLRQVCLDARQLLRPVRKGILPR